MKNTTISLDEALLIRARDYAEKMGLSFNAWVTKLISDSLLRSQQATVANLLDIAEVAQGRSGGKKWTKSEIYER